MQIVSQQVYKYWDMLKRGRKDSDDQSITTGRVSDFNVRVCTEMKQSFIEHEGNENRETINILSCAMSLESTLLMLVGTIVYWNIFKSNTQLKTLTLLRKKWIVDIFKEKIIL